MMTHLLLLAATYTCLAVMADKALPHTNDLTPATQQHGKYVGWPLLFPFYG